MNKAHKGRRNDVNIYMCVLCNNQWQWQWQGSKKSVNITQKNDGNENDLYLEMKLSIFFSAVTHSNRGR
jgi:hypothetical protein